MDGQGRLAEPLMGDAPRAAKAARRLLGFFARWARPSHELRLRLPRPFRHWTLPQIRLLPRGAGAIAAAWLFIGSLGYGAVRGGHLPEVVDELADMRDAVANTFGFRITSIALVGERHITREEILTTAGVTGRTSLLFLDAARTRTRLMSNPWIADATVLKLYPGRLHIAIVERDAFALWQKDGKVAVIADDGTVVERYVSKRFAALPLVVGVGAETRAKEFLALLGRYPALRKETRAVVLVAQRRWNVRLKSGIDVRLPETGVETALETLLKLDHDKKLLSRDITAIDLRLPDRVTVQLSDEAAKARAEALKPAKPRRKGTDA